jgi:hypothetical protein
MAKRLTIVVLAVLAISLLFVGSAFANFGPHGGYVEDTDACAACHRAHTSFSSATFQDNQGGQRSGLLVSGASSITEFCLACHGQNTPGASTNVVDGIFDAGPSAASGAVVPGTNNGVYTPYATDSTYLGALNGGAFANSTSTHQMESSNLPMWGSFDSGASPKIWGLFTCTDCHDPHGSANYRILRDAVNGGVQVGGYIGTTPNPWVLSNEIGYPASGWHKGAAGVAEIAIYKPSYTAEKFANSGVNKSMSNWCAGCHTQYATRNDTLSTNGHTTVDNGVYESSPYPANPSNPSPTGGPFSNTQDAVGNQARHRHPVNVSMTAAFDFTTDPNTNNSPFYSQPLLDSTLPLEMPVGTNVNAGPLATDSHGNNILWTKDGTIGCLTCHFAHGTSVTETGWANAALAPGSLGMIPVQLAGAQTNVPGPSKTWTGGTGATQVDRGVNPGFSSALLRDPNRGVCERCHNK